MRRKIDSNSIETVVTLKGWEDSVRLHILEIDVSLIERGHCSGCYIHALSVLNFWFLLRG